MSSPSHVEASSVHKNLIQLSLDCFERITRYLGFYDIMALELVGSPKLSAKLEQSVTEIDATIPSLFSWSFLPFRYRQLRRICINRPSRAPYGVIFAPNDCIIPIQGHTTLESLQIQNPLGLHLLRSQPGLPALSTLVPNLKRLDIDCYGVFEEEMMRNVPPKVTELKLAIFSQYHLKDNPNLDIQVLNYLPESLETFTHSLTFMIANGDRESLKEKVSLPSTLTSLEISVNYAKAFIALLTDAITHLTLLFDCEETEQVKVSEIPSKLVYFDLIPLNLGTWQFIPDVPFPSTLRSMSCMCEYIWRPGETIANVADLYPPSLKTLQAPTGLLPPEIGLSCPNLTIWHSAVSAMSLEKMTSLTSLGLASAPNIQDLVHCLPLTLKLLGLRMKNATEWIEAVTKLPNLTSLTLASPSVPLPRDRFWSYMHTRLETLQCSVVSFESMEDLGSEEWTRLQSLTLTSPNTDATLSSDLQAFIDKHPNAPYAPGNPVRFPSTLKHLGLWFDRHNAYFWPAIPDIPHLEALYVHESEKPTHKNPQIFEFMERLPSSLRVLSLKLPHSMEPRYLSKLPKDLRVLELTTEYTYKPIEYRADALPTDRIPDNIPTANNSPVTYGELWTVDHFQHLPPRLSRLSVRGHTMLDPSRLDFLPPTTLEVEVGGGGPSFKLISSRSIKEHQRLYLLE